MPTLPFGMMAGLNEKLRAELTGRLESHDVNTLDPGPDLRRAAIVFVVTDNNEGEPAILLTRRPAKMGRHAGQYALPGGKIDPGETAAEAARRELAEELGLKLSEDAELGRLDDYATRSGFVITPYVYWGGPALTLTPAPDEVELVLHISFVELNSNAIPLFEPGPDPERPILYSQFPAIGHAMYSPTAAIVYQFREICLRGQSTRVAHFDQPRFAWK